MSIVQNPLQVFTDTNGTPIDRGSIYIGEVNQDAETYPIQVYWDEAKTITAFQPIPTIAGYPVRQGAPAQMFIQNGDCSITVKNSDGVPVLKNVRGFLPLTAAELAASTGPTLIGSSRADTLEDQLDDIEDRIEATISVHKFKTIANNTVEAAGWEELWQAVREAKYARVIGDVDVPMRHENPFAPNGWKGLIFDGNGCSIMNVKPFFATYYSNFAPFFQSSIFMPNGAKNFTAAASDVNYPDAGDQSGSTDRGLLFVANAAAGDTTIQLEAATTVGRHYIYGFDRQGSDSFPPCPGYFEYVDVVSVAGAVATLRDPLKNAYRIDWPRHMQVSQPANAYGPARCLKLDRATTGGRLAYTWADYSIFNDIKFEYNPIYDPTPAANSAKTTMFSGAKNIELNRCQVGNRYITVCENFVDNDCVVLNYDEPDKGITSVTMNRSNAGDRVAGLGVQRISMTDCVVKGSFGLAPIESLDIVRGRIVGAAGAAHISAYTQYSTSRARYDGVAFDALDAPKDRIQFNQMRNVSTLQVASSTRLTITRANYNSALLCSVLRVGTVIWRRADMTPAFRVTQFNVVPAGNPDTGDIEIWGQLIGPAFASNASLTIPVEMDTQYIDVRHEGLYGRQVSSRSNQNNAYDNFIARTYLDRNIQDDRIVISNADSIFPRAGNSFGINLPRPFSVKRISIDVTKAAVNAGGTTVMSLFPRTRANVATHLWSSLDLEQAGLRIGDHVTANTKRYATDTAHSPTASVNFVLPTDQFTQLTWVDGSQGLANPEDRAVWVAVIEGTWCDDTQ